MHEYSVNSCPTVMQEALAISIENETARTGTSESFWSGLPRLLEKRKNKMCSILTKAGFRVFEANAGYFVVVDFDDYRESRLERGRCMIPDELFSNYSSVYSGETRESSARQ